MATKDDVPIPYSSAPIIAAITISLPVLRPPSVLRVTLCLNLLNVKIVGDAAVLEIGSEGIGNNSTQNTTATIKLGSAAGDQNNYDNCVIERREYHAQEGSELLLFSGNDMGSTNAGSHSSSGPDRIRLRAGAILFDTYSSASSDRTAESIRMVINKDGKVGIGTTNPGKTLDVSGLYCPSPAMQTVVELSKMQVGQVLLVLADDPAAEDDITDLCRTRGHELVQLNKNGSDLEFTIKKIK